MAFATLQEVTETSFGTNTTSHAVNMPASVDAGDLLVLIFKGFRAENTTPDPATVPAGWAALYNVGTLDSGLASNQAVFLKNAVGNEDGTTVDVVTELAMTAAAHVRRYKNWSGSVADMEIAVTAASVTQTPDPPSLTYSAGAGDNLFVEGVFAADDDATTSSYPTGYMNGADTVSGGGVNNGPSVHSSEKQSSSATEDPGTHTLSQLEGTYAFTLVIPPAAAGPVTVDAGDLTATGGDLTAPLAAALAAGAIPLVGRIVRAELAAALQSGPLEIGGQQITLGAAEEIAAGIVDLAGTDIAVNQGLIASIAARVLNLHGWEIEIVGAAEELDSIVRAITRAIARAIARALTQPRD